MYNDHKVYCLTHMLKSLLPFETEFNGHVDHNQLLIFRVDGQEICRSEAGKLTTTPLFKKLVFEKLNEIYID